MPYWRWLASKLTRKIWFRAAMISLLSVAGALASAVLAPFIPYDLSLKIGGKAVDNVLTILASSMLAVTTFSLTAMVAAFSGAAQNVTPRATQLLIEDSTAQNALSTFLGGFLFGIVGIVALSTGLYGEQGRAVLFLFTIAMIAWIALTLLRWIQTLSHFGRVPDTIARVEKAGIAALGRDCRANASEEPAPTAMPEGAAAIRSARTGYVQVIDTDGLAALAKERGAAVHVVATPGGFVDPERTLAWIDAALDDDERTRLADCFTVSRDRSFDHDPRFAMVVLAEIGSRALSPAVNDPGTAIGALVSGQRIAQAYLERETAAPSAHVVFPPLSLEELVEDLVRPIARDGAGMVEVGIRLQGMLGTLAALRPSATPAIRRLASDARERSEAAGLAETDRSRIDKAFRAAFA